MAVNAENVRMLQMMFGEGTKGQFHDFNERTYPKTSAEQHGVSMQILCNGNPVKEPRRNCVTAIVFSVAYVFSSSSSALASFRSAVSKPWVNQP
jgi:hypothetical protein